MINKSVEKLSANRINQVMRPEMWKTLMLATALAAFSSAASAQTQNQCNTRDSVISLLSNKYKEAPVAVGVTNTGGLVEVLSTGNGGTWTIIVTTPQGMSCLVAAGEGWRALEQVAMEPEA